MSRSDQPAGAGVRQEVRYRGPLTSYASQSVMLAAERNDNIDIQEVVEKFDSDCFIPDEVTVIKRTQTYYGPELLVHSNVNEEDRNYLLTAPGPGSHLYLWAGELNEDTEKREGWYLAGEVEATLETEQPPYETCDQCGELIRTIHHERESVLSQCSRA